MFDTPIIINNFNRLSTTRKLYKDLATLGYTNIIILDNRSTYLPLLDWYRSLKNKPGVTVHLLGRNCGHQALWKSGLINSFTGYDYIAYTDSDLELNKNTPKNFIEQMANISKHFLFDKVGLAIKIDDLPNNFMGKTIKGTESIYWVKKIVYRHYELYQGMIDTTFSIINPRKSFLYPALRVAGDFTCIHKPWYIDFDNIDKEEQYMLDTVDEGISTYKQHYLKYLKDKNEAPIISSI